MRQPDQRKKRPAKKSLLPWVVGGIVVGLLVLTAIAVGAWKLLKPTGGLPSVGEVQQALHSAGEPQPTPRREGVVRQAAIKVAVENPKGFVDRVIPTSSGSGQAGVCYQPAGKGSYFFDRYEGTTGKLLSHTELTGVKVPQHIALSSDGSRLAVSQLAKDQNVYRSAVTLWSLQEGRVLRSDWKPYPKGDIFDVLAWVTFLDADHLLTLTTGGRLSRWDLQGEASYSVQHGNRTNSSFRTSAYTKQPQNFALSSDQHTIALYNGEGFDLLDTANGQARSQTPAFIVKISTTILGTALTSDGQRLAVYVRVSKVGQQPEELLSIWDAKTGQAVGSFPIRVRKEKPTTLPTWGGASLDWWGPNHLLLWNGNGEAVVVEANTGKGVRDLFGPHTGKEYGYVDGAARLWYEVVVPGKKATLCAIEFPTEDLQRYPGLEGDQYYPRWWLSESGAESQPAPNVYAWPRVGPG